MFTKNGLDVMKNIIYKILSFDNLEISIKEMAISLAAKLSKASVLHSQDHEELSTKIFPYF